MSIKLTKQQLKQIVLEEEAEIVRKIFTMAETMGVKKIERTLKDLK